ncbi:MAG: hypothetical protein K6U08_08210 [Firmicutes bacterium]|nr:hypothetical protein [Bacillota bacterium]
MSAAAGGPQANSVAYGRNVFAPWPDPDAQAKFVSHEVGTHLLMGLLRKLRDELVRDAESWWALYRAYENLARFLNAKVLGEDDPYPMPDHYQGPRYDALYRELWARDPEPGLEELLRRGSEAGGR